MAIDPYAPLRLLAVLGLVLLNGFFVAAEFAIVKVRRTQLLTVAPGKASTKRAVHIVDHLDAYLSATQLGITLASLGLGWVGEPFVAKLLEGPFAALGLSEAALRTAAFAIAFLFITFLHIVLGELAPKSLAIQRALSVTLWTARPLHWFYVAFKPFIWALNTFANYLLRLSGTKPASEHEMVQSEEELRMILAEAGARKSMKKERADFLLRAFHLSDLEARNVMTPRTRVVFLDAKRPFDENFAKAKEAGYSRFPVVDETIDQVLGMVHYRDLIDLATRPNKDLRAIMRPVRFVPDTAHVENVLNELLRRGVHMAIVTDEFGSTAGIVTMEDIFEELFGEIRDEFDVESAEGPIKIIKDGHFVMAGETPIHQASAALGVDLSDHDVTTIGGYVVASLGRLPNKGERVRLGPYEGTVRDIDRRRITTLELWRGEEVTAA